MEETGPAWGQDPAFTPHAALDKLLRWGQVLLLNFRVLPRIIII